MQQVRTHLNLRKGHHPLLVQASVHPGGVQLLVQFAAGANRGLPISSVVPYTRYELRVLYTDASAVNPGIFIFISYLLAFCEEEWNPASKNLLRLQRIIYKNKDFPVLLFACSYHLYSRGAGFVPSTSIF